MMLSFRLFATALLLLSLQQSAQAADCLTQSVTPCGVLQDDSTYHPDVTLGVPNVYGGSLTFAGATSGTVKVSPQAVAGTAVTMTWPNTSGTLAANASSPLVLSSVTGTLTCPTCVTSSGGGAITGTAPIAVSAAAAVSLNYGTGLTVSSNNLVLATPVSLANGGSNASLSASAGGIVWTNASQMQVLAGTSTANQMLLSGSSATPAWSTATWPATTTASQLLYSSSANVVAGLATANNGTLITSSGGVPSISSTLPSAVQGNITSVGTVASGTWQATTVALAYGGTNANLTASNGGIFYSTASAGAILAGTSTASQMLLSGSSAAPSWSTATWPATTTVNQLLYSSSANTVAGLVTANSGVLITSSGGVPSISSTLPSAVQGNITSVGTIASGTWNGGAIPLAYGGTNANLSASNGGIVYSGSSAFAVLAGTATAGQMLQSGSSTTPAWSTATWPATTTINQVLYSSSANAVAGLATANNGIFITSSSGVPSIGTGAQAEALLLFTQTGTGAVQRTLDSHDKDYAPTVKDFGASGSSSTTTGTISGSSASLSLAAAKDFANNQGIRVAHAGASFSASLPTSPSVTNVGTTGSTTYTYKLSCLDGYGGIGTAISSFTTTTGNATLSATNYNSLSWTAGAGCYATAIYGRTSGSLTFLGTTTQTTFADQGQTGLTPPDWIPSSPPGSALADSLVTTISSGGGTTSLTLANAATTGATSQGVSHDDTAAIQACLNSLTSGGTCYVPPGQFNISSPVSYPTGVAVILTGAGRGNGGSLNSWAASHLMAMHTLSSIISINAGNVRGHQLSNLIIDGQALPYACLNVAASSEDLFYNLDIYNCSGVNFVHGNGSGGTVDNRLQEIHLDNPLVTQTPNLPIYNLEIEDYNTFLVNVTAANASYANIYDSTTAQATNGINVHAYDYFNSTGQFPTYNLLLAGASGTFTSLQTDGASGADVQVNGNDYVLTAGTFQDAYASGGSGIGVRFANSTVGNSVVHSLFKTFTNANSIVQTSSGTNISFGNYNETNAAWIDSCDPGAATGGAMFCPAFVSQGNSPTNTGSCAVTSVAGGPSAGKFVASGACVASTYIFSMSPAAPNGWACWANDIGTPTDTLRQTASSTNSITFTGTTANNDVVVWGCEAF